MDYDKQVWLKKKDSSVNAFTKSWGKSYLNWRSHGHQTARLLRIQAQNPCEGGVEYLHRDSASRKRRRNGTKNGRAIA
jgi:hypothetical protein